MAQCILAATEWTWWNWQHKTNLRYIVDNITDNCQFSGIVNKDKRYRELMCTQCLECVDGHGRRPGTYFQGWTPSSHFLDQCSLDGVHSRRRPCGKWDVRSTLQTWDLEVEYQPQPVNWMSRLHYRLVILGANNTYWFMQKDSGDERVPYWNRYCKHWILYLSALHCTAECELRTWLQSDEPHC